MMIRYALAAPIFGMLLCTHPLAAQQPAPDRAAHGRRTNAMAPGAMQMMDSLNARMDTLVARMNRASGNSKVSAMADVINEMWSQRKSMQAHMRSAMESGHGEHPHGMMGHDSLAPAPRPQ